MKLSPPWLSVLAFAAIFAGFSVAVRAQVPQIINYQGRIAVGTAPFTGSGEFRFALVNGSGTTSYWSNDGTSTAGSQPTAAVSLPVVNGLYLAPLGDTTLGMTAIPATVFANADVRVRVWFNDGTNGSQQLSPDMRITSVGYAMTAATVPDTSITTGKLAAGAVTSEKLAGSLVPRLFVGVSTDTASAVNAGALFYDTNWKALRMSDGTAWRDLGPRYDRQVKGHVGQTPHPVPVVSGLADLTGVTLTTKNLGVPASYRVDFSCTVQNAASGIAFTAYINVNGTDITDSASHLQVSSSSGSYFVLSTSALVSNVAANTVIKVRVQNGAGTTQVYYPKLIIDGVPTSQVAP